MPTNVSRWMTRRAPWIAAGAALSFAILLIADRARSGDSSCAQTLPGAFKTLCAGDAADPASVNGNTALMVAELERKLGPVEQPLKLTGCASFSQTQNVSSGASFSMQWQHAQCGLAGGSPSKVLFQSCEAPGANLRRVGTNAETGAWCVGDNPSGAPITATQRVYCCPISY